MFSIFYAYLWQNSSFMSCWYFNSFCSSANSSEGLKANCVTSADMKRDSDMVSWPGFQIDGKNCIFWCKSQETTNSSDGFIKPKIHCAWQSRDCQNHFWSLLSNTAKAYSNFMIYLNIVVKKVCNLKMGFKVTVELWERRFVPPGCVDLRLLVREELWFANECTPEQNLLLLKDQTAAYATRLGVITNLNVVNGHVNI